MDTGVFSLRRQVWVWLFAVLLLHPLGGRAADDPKSLEFKDVARDGTGRVWGIDDGPQRGLYVLDEKEQWQAAPPPGVGPGERPVCLGVRTDGTVVCIWRLGEKSYRWSTHHGPDSQPGPIFSLDERRFGHDLRMTADGRNNLWLTQEGPEIYRVAPDGTVEHAHSITEEECLRHTYGGSDASSVWKAASVFVDAAGRPWFWTNYAEGYANGATIRGALIYEDGKFVQHDFLLPGGKAPSVLTLLAQKDAQHLWFAQMSDGLYTLDNTTFQAERVPDQPKEASVTSFAAYDGCGTWHFIMGQTRPEGGCVLWRLTASKGQWEKVIDGVDKHYEFNHQEDRVWRASDQGKLLGTNDNGLWFLPRDGSAPLHVDWRQHFPLATLHRLLDLQNGHWLGISTNGQWWIGSPEALVAEKAVPDNARIRTLSAQTLLHADGHGHLWGTLTHNSPALHEWDGEHWIDHPLPAEVGANSYLNTLNFDRSGRIWLRSTSQKKWHVIYDPAADKWEVYDTFEKALEAQAGHPGAEFASPTLRFDLPRFGPQGRICYLTMQWKVAVFTEGAWRQWTRPEITSGQGVTFDGPPFINRDGRVSIDADRQTWTFVEGTGWRSTTYEPGPADIKTVSAARRWDPPAGTKLPFEPDSAVEDNQGNEWLTWQRGVYKFREGLCVSVLSASESQPFNDGRRLGSALIDARGNAFLRDRDNRGEYVIVAPPGLPPQTTLTEEAAPGGESATAARDRVVIRLATNAPPVEGKVHFSWRLDGGAWTPLTADGPASAVTLDALPAGAHRFEARSFDAALQTDAAPAVLAFTVDIDPAAQVAGYIAQLADPDFSRREAAVAALARQPERALPALRAARDGADESRRWWIDAAIQQAGQTQK